MVKVNIANLKARLSHFLKLVQNGQTVIIMKRNIEIGEITPPKPKKKRELGLARKMYPNFQWDTSTFDKPWTKEELGDWENNPIFPEGE